MHATDIADDFPRVRALATRSVSSVPATSDCRPRRRPRFAGTPWQAPLRNVESLLNGMPMPAPTFLAKGLWANHSRNQCCHLVSRVECGYASDFNLRTACSIASTAGITPYR